MGAEDESDKLKPYKKDLEYLDDHFQLISYKLKAKSMDTRMEMEVLGSVVASYIIRHANCGGTQAQYDDGYTQTQRYQRQKVRP